MSSISHPEAPDATLRRERAAIAAQACQTCRNRYVGHFDVSEADLVPSSARDVSLNDPLSRLTVHIIGRASAMKCGRNVSLAFPCLPYPDMAIDPKQVVSAGALVSTVSIENRCLRSKYPLQSIALKRGSLSALSSSTYCMHFVPNVFDVADTCT